MIRELITDADILSGRVRSPIVLRDGVCLTPAARDRAVARGMRIVEADDARRATSPAARACASCGQPAGACASGCACASVCGGACGGARAGASPASAPASNDAPTCAGAHGSARLDQLADGLYLLRVSGGRVASILPAGGPGLLQSNRTQSTHSPGSRPA